MDVLENVFRTKVLVADKSLECCKGELSETKAAINTSFIELGDVKRNLADQCILLDKWKDLLEKVRKNSLLPTRTIK